MTDPVSPNGLPLNGIGRKAKLSDKALHNGLAGIYYHSPGQLNPEGPDWTGTLELNWDQASGNRGRDWSAEWLGFLESPVEGRLCVQVNSDQMVNLYIRGNLETRMIPGNTMDEVCLTAGKGEYLPIRILYSQDGPSSSFLKVRWAWEGQDFHGIPPEYLWHSPKQRQHMENTWRFTDE
jgi:hypothetical protein